MFTIRVEPVVIGGDKTGDGFTLFLEAINAYENATEITTEAADAANAAAELANIAAANASSAAEAIREAAEAGDYDGADGTTFTPSSPLSLSGGVLTNPEADARTWFWGHYYEDGEAVLTASSTPDPARTLRTSGRICAIGKYVGLGFTPWTGDAGSTHRQYLTKVTFASDMSTFPYFNGQYLLYSESTIYDSLNYEYPWYAIIHFAGDGEAFVDGDPSDPASDSAGASTLAGLPRPRMRVAVLKANGKKKWLAWKTCDLQLLGNEVGTRFGKRGRGIVDVQFEAGSLGPGGWFEKNVRGSEVIGLTVFYARREGSDDDISAGFGHSGASGSQGAHEAAFV